MLQLRCFTFVCAAILLQQQISAQILTAVFEPSDDIVLYDGTFEAINVTISVAPSSQPQRLLLKTGETKIAEAGFETESSSEVNTTLLPVPQSDGNFTFVAIIKGKRLGKTLLIIELYPQRQNISNGNYSNSDFEIKVLRTKGIKDMLFRILIICFVLFMTLCMGSSLDINIIIKILKRPVAPAIGFLCQFIFMPCIAFGLTQITSMENSFGLGLLTIGCSPGGGGSNMWTVLLDGDLNLSMTMTFMSTIGAMAMMPLWLFALGRYFLDFDKIKIPYHFIGASLLQIVIPCIIGIALRRWKPSIADRLQNLVKPLAIFFIVFILSFGTWANLYMYKLFGDYPTMLPIGACLPWLGFAAGFLMALICKQGRKKCVTIALETGIQNIGIAVLILMYSMPQPDGELGGIMPIIVAIFTPTPLYFTLIGRTIYRRCCKKKKETTKEDIAVAEEEATSEERIELKRRESEEA